MDVMKSVNDKNKEQQFEARRKLDCLWKKSRHLWTSLVKAKLMLSKNQFSMNQLWWSFYLLFFRGVVKKIYHQEGLKIITELKIRNYDTKKDNYYKVSKFYFNVYKTAKTYGYKY
jgi:hypothetical protein